MKIVHDKHYAAWIHDDGKDIAYAGFYDKYNVEDASDIAVHDDGMFLCIGLDINQQLNRDNGSYDFKEDYARAVAQMVYEMMMLQ